MFLLTDTCFWSHAYELFECKIFDINPVISSFRLAFTDAVKMEIIDYKLEDFVPIDDILTVNISESEFITIDHCFSDLDQADQSLAIAARKIRSDNPIILTDDGELVSELLQTHFNAMRLPVFLLSLVKDGAISKNNVAKCLQFWEKVGRFKRKEIRLWKSELTKIK
ncbi:MAG: hypothetical protein ACTSWW_12695 [Promethearchaeota archaeon]